MIYRFKATLKGNSNFLREFELKPEMKLYKLHQFIQSEFEFTPDQMVIFEGIGPDKQYSEYGLFDLGQGSMDTVTLKDVIAKEETTLNYIYNVNGSRYLILEFLGEADEMPRMEYPRTAVSKGQNPDQFSDNYVDLIEATRPYSYSSSSSRRSDDDEDDEEDDDDLKDDEIYDENEGNLDEED